MDAGAALIPARSATRQFSEAVVDALNIARSSQSADDIECALLVGLVAAVGAGDAPYRIPRYGTGCSLDQINRDALAFIRTQDGLDSHVGDLCRAIDVSERSLLRAFRKFFGVGPTRYMQLRRLNRVHCELQASKETTVTGIMTTRGVTELGRFAGAYRDLFGESPSETLRRRRTNWVRGWPCARPEKHGNVSALNG